MKLGRRSAGYTIVEVMIVLAVSSALLVSALIVVNGRQVREEFNQAAQDIKAQIDGVIDNVSTGYYSSQQNFNCTILGTDIEITAGSNLRGTNKDCILLGRTIQFGVAGSDGKDFIVYDLAGRRTRPDLKQVTNKDEAMPMVITHIAPGTRKAAAGVDTSETRKLKYGLSAAKMYINGNTAWTTGEVAFITTFASYDSSGLKPGSKSVDLYVVLNTELNRSKEDIVFATNTVANIVNYVLFTPVTSVSICFNGAGVDRNATVTIGGSNNKKLGTTLKIENGACP